MKNNKPLYAYFGHHKSASSWIAQILQNACSRLNLKYISVYRPEQFDYNLDKYSRENEIDFLAYPNAHYQYVKQLKNVTGFHVIRDPRDLFVSAYFSHLYSHPLENYPWLQEHRRQLQEATKDEGLLLEMQYSSKTIKDMASWDYVDETIVHLKMEDLTADPYPHFEKLFKFMGLFVDGISDETKLFIIRALRRSSREIGYPLRIYNQKLSKKDLSEILENNSFSKKSGGRAPGEEDPKNHYRKGLAGDWKNHFNEEHIDYFVEHYNSILFQLGYETDPGWSDRYLISMHDQERT